MKKGKVKYWIPALLMLLALAAIFGGFAGRKIIFKSKLTSALNQVFSQLGKRFEDDPLLIVAKCYDPEGKYSTHMEAVARQELLGTITYNMTIDVDSKTHQIRTDGTAQSGKQTVDLLLYLDPDFMAVSSGELVAGEYYGITYDSFTSDLRKIPMLDFIVNDAVLERWDASIQEIQEKVSQEYPLPQLPELREEEIRKLLLGIAAMPCQLQKSEIIMDGKTLACTELDYTIGGEQIGRVLSKLIGDGYTGSTDVICSFYLYEDSLVRVAFSSAAGEDPFRYCVDLGLDPLHDPLSLTGNYGTSQSLSATVSTQSAENRYAESWDIHTVSEGKEQDHSFAFDWEPHSGLLNFRCGKLSAPLSLILQGNENGLRLETKDLGFLIGLLLQEEEAHSSQISGVLTISKGAAIEAPAYKNLDAWSMQDFLTLLAGVGSLMGIRLD